MTRLGRRDFLRAGTASTLALAFGGLALPRRAAAASFGPLIPDPAGVLDLPEGFSYRVLEKSGDAMSDGYRVPGLPDGMACFAGPSGTLILMRNHELNAGDLGHGPYHEGQSPPPEAYDPSGVGGVTRIVLDANTFERVSSNLVLIGSSRNCCGGPSPWGWLSCEETVEINGNGAYRHGYVFACSTAAASVCVPHRIVGYGRCRHEAVAVDPSNYYAYLTEDRGDSSFYRFVPDAMSEPFVGRLQALAIVGQKRFALTTMTVGQVLDVSWIDIDEPDPDGDTLRSEAQDKGAAILIRGEGIWFAEGQVYICSTTGGAAAAGQIFRLIDGDNPTIELLVEATDTSVLQNPDNITVAPWDQLFIAEDGGGSNFVRWVDAEGKVGDFARNAASGSEFAGVCFSPDGRALFVNMQEDGLTLVVTGPFPIVPSGGGETGGDSEGSGSSAGAGESESGLPCATTGEPATPTSERGCSCDASGDALEGLAPALVGAALVLARS